MNLKDLPQDSRPREKLLALGPAALGDAELLALLLRTGMPRQERAASCPRSCWTVSAAWPGCSTPASTT